MNDLERRFLLPAAELRFKRSSETEAATVAGLAAPYNALSNEIVEFGSSFREQIAPGAFAGSLATRDILALWNHGTDKPLGRTSTGMLVLTDTEQGLAFELKLPPTSWGRDAAIAVERQDVQGVSIGFSLNPDGDDWQPVGDTWVRTLTDVTLWEVSLVTFPAYPQTTVSPRSLDRWKQAQASMSIPAAPAVRHLPYLARLLDARKRFVFNP